MPSRLFKRLVKSAYAYATWPLRPSGVYCFNYHRIGEAMASSFDPNVFSCTAANFESHLEFFKSHFKVIDVDTLIELLGNKQPLGQKYAVLTFDDGYIDNYQIAFPLLKKHGLTAAFFIVTEFLDHPKVSWWDEVAWLVRNSKSDFVALPGACDRVELKACDAANCIRLVLSAIKKAPNLTIDECVKIVRDQCGVRLPQDVCESPPFVNWDQVNEMSQAGMDIGSHTVTHKILSHLDEAEQTFEISKSKQLIEERIGKRVSSIAYPVGGRSAFNEITMRLAKEAGYDVGFSFITEVAASLSEQWRYQFRRLAVDDNCSRAEIKKMVALSKVRY